jgi:alpha-galactosidase
MRDARKKYYKTALLVCIFLVSTCNLIQAKTVWLSELDLSKMTAGWGRPQADKSVQSNPLRIAGQEFEKGVGTHAHSIMYIDLAGQTQHFSSYVGVDDEVGNSTGTVRFKIYADGKKTFDSGVMKTGQKAKKVDLDLAGTKTLLLIVTIAEDNPSYDHANWADAKFEVAGQNPKAIDPPREEPVFLTPKPSRKPRINGAKIYGVRPARPFLYRIPTTGQRPIRFTVKNLPKGLTLDSKTGIIRGTIEDKTKRTWKTTLIAENAFGKDRMDFRIVVGDRLALTPPMGWNHWYIHYIDITDTLMRQAADVMINSGMADYGYQYVNIDDCWMNITKYRDPNRVGPLRDSQGNILPNKYFPDMKALTDYIHSLGLKAGLYTSPGPFTCQGFAGTYEHEAQDAKLFAEWGFDFLKYDWCSYGRIAKDQSLPELQKPYRIMGQILKDLDRDIVYNLCQYGMGDVWKWAEEVGGNCWRTAGDLGFELTNYHNVALRNSKHRPYAVPGAWNDPDYLLLGYIGQPNVKEQPYKPCPLTPNEQYSYMSLWCLMASPLFFSGDMNRLDDFTLNVLCNAELIEVNQDPLGKQGYPVIEEEEKEIWKKTMEDGSVAVGLFNRGETEQKITLKFSEIEMKGKYKLRDLWRQKDLGIFENKFETKVPQHGVMMLRLYPGN